MSASGIGSALTSRVKLVVPFLAAALLLAVPQVASAAVEGIVCRPELSDARRHELAVQLREITGWPALHFDADGVLDFGGSAAAGGSPSARDLLREAARGARLLVVEDASDRADVVFSRVVEARWRRGAVGRPPVFLVQVDFADFSRVTGDRAALASFNAAWGVLHEIAHVVQDVVDASGAGEVGECEALINRMRRECGLAERAEYHFHFLPGQERSDFLTRYVRLAFVERRADGDGGRRLYVMWDATLVGGLGPHAR